MFSSLDQVIDRISAGERFLVLGHIKPDGDDVSSVASLVMILRAAGKTAEGCIPDELPDFVGRLSCDGILKSVDELRSYSYDTSITVDSSDLERIGRAADLLRDGIPDITIDHHKTNVGFGKLNVCDPSYAAAAMIICEIGEKLDLADFDSVLAETLLLGIATDSGFFRYPNTDERALSCAAALVRRGASISRISEAVLEHRTLSEIQLAADMFGTLEILADGRLAAAHIAAETLEKRDCTLANTVGLIGQLRSIGGVEVAILFVELPNGTVNVEFRSKNRVDVSEIAVRFGGGGHAPASGCSLPGIGLDETKRRVIADAEETIAREFGGQPSASGA